MLTNFGKLCRKLRIDSNQVLFDMARILDVAPSFLSAVENGKKNVPEAWCDIIRDAYGLHLKEYNNLLEAKETSKTQVKLNLVKSNEEARDLAFSFARNFDSLSGEQRDKILRILKG